MKRRDGGDQRDRGTANRGARVGRGPLAVRSRCSENAVKEDASGQVRLGKGGPWSPFWVFCSNHKRHRKIPQGFSRLVVY